jgi:hypothetical protein
LLALAASAHLRQAAGYARSSRLVWCKNSSPEMRTLFSSEPLDVLDDIFSGGYGLYNLEEKIVINWTNFRRSQEKMSSDILELIINIFKSHKNVILIVK